MPCASDPQYTVPGGRPPGSVHRKSKAIAMPESGRIVAVGGHLHGGAHELRLTQPRCGNRTIAVNAATYAPKGDPLYRVHPLLHEPDPKSIDDGSRPHMRVMGLSHVYLAPDDSVPRGCAPPPEGGETLGPDFEGRDDPPAVRLTLAEWRGRGRAKLIDRPSGSFTRTAGDARVNVKNFAFDPPLLSVPRGATLRWAFRDRYAHDATVVRGPRGFATATVRNRVERYRFDEPGEYKLYCSIHPVLMSQVVRVRSR